MLYKRILLTEICRKGKISKENMFYHLVSDAEIKIDKFNYPDSVFFFKNNKVLFKQNSKSNKFWYRYHSYWLVFINEFGMGYNEIQSFTKNMVKKHFKMRVSTPQTFAEPTFYAVEKYFKMKTLTL